MFEFFFVPSSLYRETHYSAARQLAKASLMNCYFLKNPRSTKRGESVSEEKMPGFIVPGVCKGLVDKLLLERKFASILSLKDAACWDLGLLLCTFR